MDPEKKQQLAENGYLFDSDLLCFVNEKDGKIFSSAWVDQNNANTLKAALFTPHNPIVWKISLNPDQPHEEIRTSLFEKYGKTP